MIANLKFSVAQGSVSLVAAQSGRVIRATRLLYSSLGTVKITLLNDPGALETELLSATHVANRVVQLPLGRGHAICTEPGKALGLTAAFQGTPNETTVIVWYEYV